MSLNENGIFLFLRSLSFSTQLPVYVLSWWLEQPYEAVTLRSQHWTNSMHLTDKRTGWTLSDRQEAFLSQKTQHWQQFHGLRCTAWNSWVLAQDPWWPRRTLESAATLWASSASTSGSVSAFRRVCCSFCSASSRRSCNWRFLSSVYRKRAECQNAILPFQLLTGKTNADRLSLRESFSHSPARPDKTPLDKDFTFSNYLLRSFFFFQTNKQKPPRFLYTKEN
jgi:hypothetical protein